MSSPRPDPRTPADGSKRAPAPKPGFLRRACGIAWAILRQRCPRCHKGRLFRGLFAMNDPCTVCGLVLQREEGYFLGAMYASFVLSAALMAAIYFPLAALLQGWNGVVVTSLAMLLFLPFTFPIFQYSRTLWIHFERGGCPGSASATVYEKARLREAAERRGEERRPQA